MEEDVPVVDSIVAEAKQLPGRTRAREDLLWHTLIYNIKATLCTLPWATLTYP